MFQTRFHPRRDLVEEVLTSARSGLVAIAAPAGYGKSWLALEAFRQWRSEEGPDAVRLWRIEPGATPRQLLADFLECLGEARRPLPARPSSTEVVELISDRLGVKRQLPAFVLDVDGAPPGKEVRSILAQVIAKIAPKTRMVLACRRPEHFSISRLNLIVPIEVIGPSRLAFTADEISSLFSAGAPQADTWSRITLGWPVACGLNALPRLSPHADHDELMSHAVDAVEQYLETELLDPLPENEVKLLLHVSVLNIIEPGPFEALSLRTPWSRFMNLIDAGLPILTTDRHCDRVVLHPVLRAYLRRRCRAWFPIDYARLNSSAAEYYLSIGDRTSAMAQAEQLNDFPAGAEIADKAGGWRLCFVGGLKPLQGVSGNCELNHFYPRATLANIYWKAQTGRVEEANRELAALRLEHENTALMPDIRAVSTVISVYRDEPLSSNHLSTLACGNDPFMVPGGETLQAALLNNQSSYASALPIALSAITSAERLGSPYIEFYGRWQHALSLHGLGRVREAGVAYQKVITLADDVFGESSNESRIVSLTAAHASYLAGEGDKADTLAGDLGALHRLHTWYEVYVRSLSVSLTIARYRGGENGSIQHNSIIEEFRAIARSRRLRRLEIAVELEQVREALRNGDTETARHHIALAVQIAQSTEVTSRRYGELVWLPIRIEQARTALYAGDSEQATVALEPILGAPQMSMNAEQRVQVRLLGAYAALRRRRLREAAALLSACADASSTDEMVAPFLDKLNLGSECLAFVNEHGVPVDATTHQKLRRLIAPLEAPPTGTASAPVQTTETAPFLLTQRETDVLVLLAEALSSKEIARRLSIAEGTVRTHRKHLYEKLGGRSRSQILVRARDLKLL